MHSDVGMFLIILVVAEAVGLGIVLLFATQGGMYTGGRPSSRGGGETS